MRRIWIVSLSLVLTLSAWSPASAHYLFHADGNDTSSRLDVKGVRLARDRDEGLWRLTIRTHQGFRLRRHGQLLGWFDTRGGPLWDYGFHLHFDGGSDGIFCDWRNRRSGEPHRNPVVSWRVGRDVAKCWFRTGGFTRTKHIRWRVESRTLDEVTVLDQAPDGGGWYAH